MTGGAAAKARAVVYDLSVPAGFPPAEKVLDGQLVVPDPTALGMLDSEKILIKSAAGAGASVVDAQWGDTVPKMLQMKIIQAFENAGSFAAVSRPVEGLTGDFQLLIDIRRFQLSAAAEPVAEVEFAGKVLDGSGRILDTHIFRATQPTTAATAPAATAALDQAFGRAATELVVWTSRTVGDRAQGPGAPKGAVRNKAPRG
jgi:phospholipid/cholesterol/gamma-HCH transport system substrate-binding protein